MNLFLALFLLRMAIVSCTITEQASPVYIQTPTPIENYTYDSTNLKAEARVGESLIIGATTISKKSNNPNQTKKIYVYPVTERNRRTFNATAKDTYLDALEFSRKKSNQRVEIIEKAPKVARRQYMQGPVYRPDADEAKEPSSSYGPPSTSYGSPSTSHGPPSTSYGTPITNYGSPSGNYGSPSTNYGSPSTNYGSPSSSYGPPSTSYGSPNYVTKSPYTSSRVIYGSSQNGLNSDYEQIPSVSYSLPNQASSNFRPHSGGHYYEYERPHHVYDYATHSYNVAPSHGYGYEPEYYSHVGDADYNQLSLYPIIDLKWPIAMKINAITLAKIIFKIVIFKLAVKFIAGLCVLLLLPKLVFKKSSSHDDDDDESRKLGFGQEHSRLNYLTSVVTRSIEKYTELNKEIDRSTNAENSWEEYVRLFKQYAEEEQLNTKQPVT